MLRVGRREDRALVREERAAQNGVKGNQSNFAPDSLTTFAQRAFSSRMNAPNCCGDCGRVSAPAARSFSFISGVARIAGALACSFFTTSGRGPAGAPMPCHDPAPNPRTPHLG